MGTFLNLELKEKENTHYIFGEMILKLFRTFQLNPKIRMPDQPPNLKGEPLLSDHIMRAARAQSPDGPINLSYGGFSFVWFI